MEILIQIASVALALGLLGVLASGGSENGEH